MDFSRFVLLVFSSRWIVARTKTFLQSQGISLQIKTIDPVGYFDMLMLLHHCSMVLTDSGGLQKEAYLSDKFCLTLRDQTEWTELVSAGANRLVGARSEEIIKGFRKYRQKKIKSKNLYGKGDAAEKIAKSLSRL